ncbi:hypothetical protein [Amycolatopsis mediterranei]|uniref:Uncharacterized protein n=1 Tax=Amycolatopsis mediterranei (strain S699) TaxID=713604 RepID=A0A9R0P3W5_AMYMS|nr:hypothetical protein [Amycolatopsis mediterranei]AEK45760.1 hypothetical protein RAM_36435 [Amycolatopsis mediterranei S699]KDU94072.1 hypothetical protein DV36_01655 [Amycolatopsis mediterranei]UZF73850.1 hypothetical protein ISP_007321 [Amycolatopsis mediterranei]
MAEASADDTDSGETEEESSSSEGAESPVEDRPVGTKRRSFALKGLLVGLLTFVGLVATTVAGVYAAVYTVTPDLRPREKLGATIDHIAVEHAVDYTGYLQRMGDTDTTRPQNVSPMPGDMVFVRVSLLGYKDRSYGLQIQLLDERGVQLPPREGTPPPTDAG